MASSALLYPGFHRMAYQCFAAAYGLIASGCFLIEILQPTIARIGIWTSFIYLSTGALGLAASCKYSKNGFNATVGFAIISLVASISGIILSSFSISEICNGYNPERNLPTGGLLITTPQSSSSRTLNTKSSSIYDGLAPQEKEELCTLLCYNLLTWHAIALVNSIILMALTPKEILCPKPRNQADEQHHDGSLPTFMMANQTFSYYYEQPTLAGHSVNSQHHQYYPQYPLQASNSQEVPKEMHVTSVPESYSTQRF